MDVTTVVGLGAGALTTIAFIPQVVKTWREKSAKDLSFEMLVVFCVGLGLWVAYGFLLHEPPIIITNAVTLALALAILAAKLRYG